MPAAEGLDYLAQQKLVVRARIAERRAACVAAVENLKAPLVLVDRGITLWRSVPSPGKYIGIAAGLFVARKIAKRFGPIASLVRYAPLAMQAWQAFSGLRRSRDRDGASSASAS